jgi:hypothetical protein
LEPINILAFTVTLVGLGLLVYGLITVDHPLEHIGILVATIAGCVALGTLIGIVSLPFAPWIFLAIFLAGVGYAADRIYVKWFRKPAAAVATIPEVK